MPHLKIVLMLLSAFLVACAGVDPYAGKNPDSFDYEAEYTAFLRTADLLKLSDFFVSINREKDVNIQAAGCVASLNILRKQLQKNYLSVAAHYYLMKCYAEKTNIDKAAYHETVLKKIFTGMYADRDGSSQAEAITYLTNSDVLVSLMLANYQLLDAYLELNESGKKAFFVTIIRDNGTGQISKKYFSNSRLVDALYEKAMPQLFAAIPGLGSGLLLLKSLEKENTTEALLSLGDYYRLGKWETQNFTKAAEHYRKAVDKGSLIGRIRLAELYLLGRGVEQNFEQGIDLLLQGLEMGYAEAEIPMAVLYKYGKGVDKNPDSYNALMEDITRQLGADEANRRVAYLIQEVFAPALVQDDVIDLLMRAADLGSHQAMLQLGNLFEKGYGNYSADEKHASKWFQRAVDAGSAEGLFALGSLQSAKGRFHEAFEYFLKAAEQGLGRAQAQVCWYYHKGKGSVKADQEKAAEWCRRGVEQADTEALFYYGTLLGLGLIKNESSVEKQYWLYNQAASQGSAEAQLNLAALLLDGHVRNQQGYRNWLMKAAESGVAQAQYELGNAYYFFGGTASTEVWRWLREAANQGHVDAMLKLAELYQKSAEPSDQKWAERWYEDALKSGSGVAKWRLRDLRENREMQKPIATVLKYGIMRAREERTAANVDNDSADKKTSGKRNEMVARMDQVPAALGQQFHVVLILKDLPDDENKLNVEIEHPPMTYPDGTKKTQVSWTETITVKKDFHTNDVSWLFEHPYELVEGEWVVRFFYNSNIIAEKHFSTYRIEE